MIRTLDIVFSFCAIVVLLPVFVLLYVAIVIESKGGGIYKQVRVGKNGVDFLLFKFRSMRIGSDAKGLITVGGRDPRITQMGYFIRTYKLDELPQLFNVLKGDMSLVGPRPEVRKYVDMYTVEQQKVLAVRPGITDYASIEYAFENELLARSSDPEKIYIEEVMPDKIRYNMKYINHKTVAEYFKIILLTVKKIITG